MIELKTINSNKLKELINDLLLTSIPKNIVVHVPSEDKANELFLFLKEKSFEWAGREKIILRDSIILNTKHINNKENTTYRLSNDRIIRYGKLNNYLHEKYFIPCDIIYSLKYSADDNINRFMDKIKQIYDTKHQE